MKPKLVAISGPLKGSVFPLDSEITIGRQADHQIYLEDGLVSRNHCSIRLREGCAQVEDHDSMNGTMVNDIPVREKTLKHGDRLRIGGSQLVFLDEENGVGGVPSFIESSDDHFTPKLTLRLPEDKAVYLQPDKISEELSSSTRMGRDLGALLRISASINAIRNSEELQARLLKLILEIIPAQRASILLVGHRQDDFASASYCERDADINVPFRLSRTVAHQVLHEGIGLMSNDVLADETINPTESLVSENVRSILCVPLKVFEKRLGVIYADSVDRSGGFDPDHLQLLTAIASIAAVSLEHVRYVEWLEGENERLREEVTGEHGMIGESPLMKEVFRKIGRVAPTDSTVLICGESGTGKELVAAAIHRLSRRSNGPFVSVNCAVSTESLLESDLFGHERGAFTGAVALKKGKFELADGGSLFLDEVGEMTMTMQTMLLRVLEGGEIRRVGGTKTLQVNVRVIAATNRNLQTAIAEGRFRADLFYRLNVFPINLAPLRQRREDIPILANYFLQKYAREMERTVVGFAPDVMPLLVEANWAGNVRELENNIARAVIMTTGDRVTAEDLPENLNVRFVAQSSPLSYEKAHEDLSKHLILEAFRKSQYKYSEAAHLLGLHPNYLHRLIKNLQIKDVLESARLTDK